MSRRKQPASSTKRVRPALSIASILIVLAVFFAVRTGLVPNNGNGGSPEATAPAVTTAPAGSNAAQGIDATPEPVAQATGTSVPTPNASATPGSGAITASPQVDPPTPTANAPPVATRASDLPTIAYADLPGEAHATIRLIDQDGPFPFDRDGITFQNRERLLPLHPQGYYREYTVITPGERTRGARRIVTGAGGEMFYTEDHYDSFREIIR